MYFDRLTSTQIQTNSFAKLVQMIHDMRVFLQMIQIFYGDQIPSETN